MIFKANICDLSKQQGDNLFAPHSGNFEMKMIVPNNSRIEMNNKGKVEIFRVIKTIVFHAENKLTTLPIAEQVLIRTDELFIDKHKAYFLLQYFPLKPVQNMMTVDLMDIQGDIKKVSVIILPSPYDYICFAKKCFRSKNIIVKKNSLLLNHSAVSDLSEIYSQH